jgi:hypothetical protein
MSYTAQQKIDDRFARFHYDNPHVYDELVRLARRAQSRGHKTIGIELLFAVIRWESMMTTRDSSGFKLNDHYTSRYARMIMEREPDLNNMFRTRKLRAA